MLSGALSGIVDLAATDATTTMLVNVLVSVGQFQRDLQNEMTREGLAAAWSLGSKSGRRPQVAELGVLEDVRAAFGDGASIAALARQHSVSRAAIRTAVADLMSGRSQPAPRLGSPVMVVLEMPGKLACHLRDHESLGEAERHVLLAGREVRRGQGYTLHITAPPQTHQALLAAADALADAGSSSADRKAYRIYQQRVLAAADEHVG